MVSTEGQLEMSKKAAKNDGVIKFQATAAQVKTMADGGIRIALDLSESETETAKALMDCRRLKGILEVLILPVISIQENGETNARDRIKRNPLYAKKTKP
jgi:hypothetical protein